MCANCAEDCGSTFTDGMLDQHGEPYICGCGCHDAEPVEEPEDVGVLDDAVSWLRSIVVNDQVNTHLVYGNGAMIVQFRNQGYWETLSVNIPNVSDHLPPGEFCVKNWSENEKLAQAALASGLFSDTGATVKTGFVQAPIWKVKS